MKCSLLFPTPAACASLCCLFVASAFPATITVDPASSSAITKTRKIGLNIEMALLEEPMWLANGQWIRETFNGNGFNVMRWGYGAWEWDWANEAPLDFDYWASYNRKDAFGSFGLRDFIAYCKGAGVVPMLMIPVEIQKFPEHTWQNVKDMAGAMAAYVNSQSLSTPVYFELGNEPSFTVSQSTYNSRLNDMSPVINGVNPAFKFGASADPNYTVSSLTTNAGAAIDFIDFHRYTALSFWTAYYNKDNDSFFTHPSAGGEEAFMGECNILWPDWDGRMPNDLQGSLPLLNGFLNLIEANTEQYITSWPSHWPGRAGDEPYGLFNYDLWQNTHQTKLFTGPIYAHRIVNESVLESRLTGESCSDAKVRVYGYTNSDQSRLNLIVINKKSTAEPLAISTTVAYSYVQAFVLQGAALDTEAPTYQPHLPAMTTVGSSVFNNTVPARSAVVYTFYNDGAAGVPGAFSLSSPAGSATGVSTYKTFTWGASSGAKSYRLVIAANSAFTTPVFDREVGLQTKYQVAEAILNNSTTYYWKVVAKNKNGETNASGNGRSFTTAPAVAAPQWSGALANGSFEEGFKGWTNWGGAMRTAVAGEVLTGAYSGKVGLVSGGIGQDVFGLVPGNSYRLNASTRTTSALDAVTVAVTFYNSGGTQISEASWQQPQVTDTVNAFYSFTVPAGTWRAVVWVWKEGANGSIFMDNIATTDAAIDNGDGTGIALAGAWTSSTFTPGYVGADYIHDGNAGKGTKSVTFTPALNAAGAYDVYVAYTSETNRASNVPVTVNHATGSASLTLNQRIGDGWHYLGTWNFAAGTSGSLVISNTGTNGYVMADAVRFSKTSATKIKLSSSQLGAYDVQDGALGLPTSATVSGDGTSISIVGNVWKKHVFTYNVTPATVLEFTVSGSDTGEVLGIALDNDALPTNNRRAFLFAGSDVGGAYDVWSWKVASPVYAAGSGSVTYVVPVGMYFTGSVSYLGFIGDDDANGSTSATFSNIRLYEP